MTLTLTFSYFKKSQSLKGHHGILFKIISKGISKNHQGGLIIDTRYAMVLQWISEIWDEFDSNLIARSFDSCGITSSKLTDFNNQLRHFVRTTEFVDEVQPDDSTQNHDLFEENGDEWGDQTQAIIGSESEDEN